jgi:hypothetical protein
MIVLVVHDGQTQSDLAASARARGIKPSEICVAVVYLREADALV